MAYKTYDTPMQGTSAYHLRLGYELVEQNQEANTSTVKYAFWIIHSDTSQRAFFNLVGDASTWVRVNTETVARNRNFKYNFRQQTTYLAHEGTVTVEHDAQGNASVFLQGHFDPALDGTGVGIKSTTAAITVPLPRIGRVREFTLEKDTVEIGELFQVTITDPIDGYTYKREIVQGNMRYSYDLATHTSFGMRAPLDLLNRLPDRTSVEVTIRITTIVDGKELGTTSQQATVIVPDNLRPSVQSVQVKNANADDVAFFKSDVYFFSRRSTAWIQVTPSTETHGARIVEYEARVVENHEKRTSGRNAVLSFAPFDDHAGELKTYHIEGRVKDSRGRYSGWVKSDPLYVIEYKRPRLGNIKVTREGSGTSAVVIRNYEVDRLDLGEGATNFAELTFYTRRVGTGSFTKNAGAGSKAFNLENSEALLSGTFLPTEGYEIKAVLKDYFSEITTTAVLGTEAVPFDISKQGAAVGKFHEEGQGVFQVKGDGEVPAIVADGDVRVRNGDLFIENVPFATVVQQMGGGMEFIDRGIKFDSGLLIRYSNGRTTLGGFRVNFPGDQAFVEAPFVMVKAQLATGTEPINARQHGIRADSFAVFIYGVDGVQLPTGAHTTDYWYIAIGRWK